ncbi:MAG: hypothetical protein HOE38_02550, partial [Proteobacteria bacterium]|nr:hypothetical protein [Pseudomonadota bacterium]
MKIKLLGIALFALLFIGSLHSFAQEVSDEISIHIERIKLAFAAGEISEEEAEAKIDELLGTIKDDDDQDWEGGGDRGEEDEDWFEDVPDDVLTEIKRIKSAFAAGEISEDKAEAKIDELLGTIKDDDDQDWKGDGDRGKEDEDWFEDVPDDVLTEIKRIKSAFAAGEISEDKAEAKIDELLGTIKEDDDEEWEDGEKGESSILVNEEGLISD